MAETPLPNSVNSNIDPGWQQVAQEMHTYHPALQEHAARNLAERGIEISPEHHQEHVDIARHVVPNIDELTTQEQDFAGEVIEIGHEALEDEVLPPSATQATSLPHFDGPLIGVKKLPNGELDYSHAAVISFPDRQEVQSNSREATANKDLPLQKRFELAVDEIKNGSAPEQTYTLETAEQERPFTHYTNPGNIFQILRFGIQSGNFKNRIDALRTTDPKLNDVAKQLSGLRFKKGGSYQGADSISLGLYSSDTVRNQDLVLLVDPDAKVFGLDPSHRTKSGYGHGIEPGDVDGGFNIGNPIAYQNEVVAANIVPPSEIKGVIMNERVSILSSLRDITREYVVLYQQTKNFDPQATKENLFANSRLIASLSGEPDAEAKIEALSSQIDTMQTKDIIKSLTALQKDLLQGLVGRDQELSESTIKDIIQSKFGIRLLTNKQFAEAA